MDRKYGGSEENRIFRTISYFLSLISYFSCVAMTNKTTKHTSIVNRLHGHYRWQKFLYTLVFDLLLVGVAMVTWGLTLESAVCGVPFLSEAFRAAQRWVTWEGIHISPNLTQLFEGLEYHVRLMDSGAVMTEHVFDASGMAAALFLCFLVLVILQLVFSGCGAAADRHAIRRILRPIDDIALTAERISQKGMLFADTGEEEMLRAFADALDHIDDLSEDSRITVQERELASLEAAVNNMLRRLARSQKEQIRFVDDASHELRTPIAVIQGYVGMLDRWGKDDPAVMEESIAAIKTEAEHMKTLVDQLLFLARGESDRLEMKMEPVNGCGILRELWEEYRMIDPEHQYTLRLPVKEGVVLPEDAVPAEEDTEVLTIQADTALMKQSLRTMLDNAGKFTPAGGTITLTARTAAASGAEGDGKEEVVLEIADSGIGIPAEDLPRIFDRFWRGSAARSGVSGSGLGLSIAKWIVERHGGRIDAASAPGLGTKIGVAVERSKK